MFESNSLIPLFVSLTWYFTISFSLTSILPNMLRDPNHLSRVVAKNEALFDCLKTQSKFISETT